MPRGPRAQACPPAEILADADPKVASLARRVSKLVRGMIDGVEEVGDPALGRIRLRRRDFFAWIEPRADHVRLGLERGASLPDFGGLLEGRGARARHVTIRAGGELGSIALKTLLSAALFDDDTHGFRKRTGKTAARPRSSRTSRPRRK